MNINLKILHLHRAFFYTPMEKPASVDEAALSGLAAQYGECLLVFAETGLSTITDDGPALSVAPIPIAVYKAVPQEVPGGFSLDSGDYLFFQWRARNASGSAPISHASSPPLFQILEEVLREAWWQRIECSGPWFLRLVPEDERVALQILRRARD